MADGVATVSRDGRTVATLERGDIVGEMALLDEQGSGRCNATVMVKSDSLVYAGSRAEFHRILESVPAVDRSVRQAAAIRTARRAA
jgi:CRP-like cAMP-binding protein